jgi:hypothetical protein
VALSRFICRLQITYSSRLRSKSHSCTKVVVPTVVIVGVLALGLPLMNHNHHFRATSNCYFCSIFKTDIGSHSRNRGAEALLLEAAL